MLVEKIKYATEEPFVCDCQHGIIDNFKSYLFCIQLTFRKQGPKGFRAPGLRSKICGAPGLQDKNIGVLGLH